MNAKLAAFLGFFFLLALTACEQPSSATADPRILDFGFDETRAACQASSECVLMKIGICDKVQAIHLSQVDRAREYSEQSKQFDKSVQCAPSRPIEDFAPLCLNQRCRAVPRIYHLILEAPDPPMAGQPFWIGLRFNFNHASADAQARIELPPGVELLGGQVEWRGLLRPGSRSFLGPGRGRIGRAGSISSGGQGYRITPACRF